MSAPTQPGWYWLRLEPHAWVAVWVIRHGDSLVMKGHPFSMNVPDVTPGAWGPKIEPPPPTEGRNA